MKAEQRKEIETNSLVLAVQRLRKHVSSRTLYYVIGCLAVVAAIVGFYYYFSSEKAKTRDAILLQLAMADTPEKLKVGMEEHRGTIYGSLFKIQLARHYLKNEGLPKLGTDSSASRLQAANSVDEARKLYVELTSEFKEKEEPGLLQEAWLGAAEAEEALVGVPKADKDVEYRGSAEKAIEYYEKAAAIFPESESSKRYKAWAEKIQSNKEKFVSDQKEIYKPARSLFPPSKTDPPLGPGLPFTPKGGPPPVPTGPPPVLPPDPKVPEPPQVLDPKNTPDAKSTEPKLSDTPKDPKKSSEPKPADPPKGPDPKAK